VLLWSSTPSELCPLFAVGCVMTVTVVVIAVALLLFVALLLIVALLLLLLFDVKSVSLYVFL